MQYEMVVIADRGCSPLIWLSFLNFWRNNISSYYDERRYNSLIAMINIINIGCYIIATIDIDSNENGCYLRKWLLSVNMVVILKLS